MMHGQKNIKLT